MNYTYDNASRRATMTVVGQPQVTYTYDNANRLTTITQNTSTVTIGYDDADRRTSVTYPNTNSITYAHNAASELTSLTYKQGATTLGDLTYTYDATSNRIKTGGTFASSNIPPALTTTNYNANNQQTTFETTTETYDLNGNLATSTDAGVTTTYTWNARNQLTDISKTGFSASFTYDSFGRRTGRTVQGTTTNYVYDGLNPVQEKNGGTVIANLLTGLGIDEFFTRTDGVGVRALLSDALGSTVALGDGSGTLQTQYTYEPFGFTTQTGSASTSSYKFTGREDDGTGLMYYRARYYHPRLQRFISEDPIGLMGGDINLYVYANGDPISNSDPTGEFVPLIVILPTIGGIAGGIVDVLGAGECESKLTAFGRGFLAGAAGTLAGIGTVSATGNPWLAGAAAGAVSQGLDQAISGRADLQAAATAVGAGSVSGGLLAKLLPTKGRLPDLLTPRTRKNIGPNSLRMIGQETGSDAIAAAVGLAVPSNKTALVSDTY